MPTHILDLTAPEWAQTSILTAVSPTPKTGWTQEGSRWLFVFSSLLSKGSAFCLSLLEPWSSEHPCIYTPQDVFTVFLRTPCEWNSSHPVLNEVIPPGSALSFSFFLPGQPLHRHAEEWWLTACFPGRYLSWMGKHRRKQTPIILVCPSQCGVRWGGAIKAVIL